MPSQWVDAIEKFVASPPGHVVASGVIAGIVWRCFDRLETLLTDTSKLEIAVWLVGVDVSGKWQKALSAYLGTLYGDRRRPHRMLWVSVSTGAMATIVLAGTVSHWVNSVVLDTSHVSAWDWLWLHGIVFLTFTLIAMLGIISSSDDGWANSEERTIRSVVSLLGVHALFVGFMLIVCVSLLTGQVGVGPVERDAWSIGRIAAAFPVQSFVIAFLLCTVWLWLYCFAAIILRFTRRFDLGLQWFTRKFDIEKKPLQSIGMVAGPLVAVIYWLGVLIMR